MPKQQQQTNQQAQTLDYSIIQYKPSIERQEAVNIGVALFTEKGQVLEYSNTILSKINALNADVLWSDVVRQIQQIEEATRLLIEAKVSKRDLIIFLSRDQWMDVQYSQHRTLSTEGRTMEEIILQLMEKFVLPISRKKE